MSKTLIKTYSHDSKRKKITYMSKYRHLCFNNKMMIKYRFLLTLDYFKFVCKVFIHCIKLKKIKSILCRLTACNDSKLSTIIIESRKQFA